MEYDGKTIAQSRAIARFLGRKYGLAGKTEFEDAEADMIVDYIAETNDGKCWLVVQQSIFWTSPLLYCNNIISKRKYLPNRYFFVRRILRMSIRRKIKKK